MSRVNGFRVVPVSTGVCAAHISRKGEFPETAVKD